MPVTISQYVKNNIIENYNISSNKISVVNTGLGGIKPFLGDKDYTVPKILFVAKQRFEDKGGKLIINAFKLAIRVNPNIELIMVCEEKYNETIKDIPNVTVYNYLPLDKLQELFNSCSVFAMPANNEPWGLVYLEALACKMPIIGINKNALDEITDNGKYGYLSTKATPDDLAVCILDSVRDTKKLKEIGVKGQQYCLNKFSWESTTDKIISVIDEISG